MRRLFLDTNVLLDFAQRRQPWYADAAAIMQLRVREEVTLYASTLSFAIAAYVMRKEDRDDTKRRLRSLLGTVTAEPLQAGDLSTAFAAVVAFADLEDAMQHASAIRADAEVIITRDADDFTAASLPVMTPAQFLAQRAAAT